MTDVWNVSTFLYSNARMKEEEVNAGRAYEIIEVEMCTCFRKDKMVESTNS